MGILQCEACRQHNSEEGHARLEEEGSSSADFHAMSESSLSSLLVLKSQSRECALE